MSSLQPRSLARRNPNVPWPRVKLQSRLRSRPVSQPLSHDTAPVASPWARLRSRQNDAAQDTLPSGHHEALPVRRERQRTGDVPTSKVLQLPALNFTEVRQGPKSLRSHRVTLPLACTEITRRRRPSPRSREPPPRRSGHGRSACLIRCPTPRRRRLAMRTPCVCRLARPRSPKCRRCGRPMRSRADRAATEIRAGDAIAGVRASRCFLRLLGFGRILQATLTSTPK
jgi:hypothetical protein